MTCQIPSDHRPDVPPRIAAGGDPFDESLWGEYARTLIVGTSACSAILWLLRFSVEPAVFAMVVANILVLGVAVGSRFAGLPRFSILSLSVIGIVAAFSLNKDPSFWWSPLVMFSPLVTVSALLVLLFRDGFIAMRKRVWSISLGKVTLVGGLLALLIYMVVVPAADAFLEPFRDHPSSYVIKDPSPMEILRVRSAKFAVFAIFAYAGACIGSFVNVVAASAPRGESIVLRASACPQCSMPLRRIDNLPILGYLHLRGHCRDCAAVIPVRYFMVELVGFAIFALLFLCELVTGAANVPGFLHYSHAGILWIILYTKWPVIGVYLLHGALFSCVLMLALMEQDRLRVPRWMTLALPIIFAGIVIAFPMMLTVSFGDQTPFQLPASFPDWADRAATSAAGGVMGWALGSWAKSTRLRLRQRQSSSSLSLAFGLLGIAMGWQAVLAIAALWVVAVGLLKYAGGREVRPRWLTTTTLLLVVAMLHHPAWKWIAGQFSF